MVYKIQGDFQKVHFPLLFSQMGKFFKIIYKNNNMYIASNHYDINFNEDKFLKKELKKYNLICFNINETNIMREDEEIINWCRDNLVRLEKERYEIENQAKLQEIMKNLDKMESILKEKYRKGVKNGTTGEKEERKTS